MYDIAKTVVLLMVLAHSAVIAHICAPGRFAVIRTGEAAFSMRNDRCAPCPAGQWQPLQGSTACVGTPCAAGRFGRSGRALPPVEGNLCLPCAAGRYQPHAASTQCALCQPGRADLRRTRQRRAGAGAGGGGGKSKNTNSDEHLSDGDGHVSMEPSVECAACGAGRAQPLAGSIFCEACASGHFAPASSAVPAVTISSRHGNVKCLVCPKGKYSSLGAAFYAQARRRRSRGQTETSTRPGPAVCSACPASTPKTVHSGATRRTDCVPTWFRAPRTRRRRRFTNAPTPPPTPLTVSSKRRKVIHTACVLEGGGITGSAPWPQYLQHMCAPAAGQVLQDGARDNGHKRNARGAVLARMRAIEQLFNTPHARAALQRAVDAAARAAVSNAEASVQHGVAGTNPGTGTNATAVGQHNEVATPQSSGTSSGTSWARTAVERALQKAAETAAERTALERAASAALDSGMRIVRSYASSDAAEVQPVTVPLPSLALVKEVAANAAVLALHNASDRAQDNWHAAQRAMAAASAALHREQHRVATNAQRAAQLRAALSSGNSSSLSDASDHTGTQIDSSAANDALRRFYRLNRLAAQREAHLHNLAALWRLAVFGVVSTGTAMPNAQRAPVLTLECDRAGRARVALVRYCRASSKVLALYASLATATAVATNASDIFSQAMTAASVAQNAWRNTTAETRRLTKHQGGLDSRWASAVDLAQRAMRANAESNGVNRGTGSKAGSRAQTTPRRASVLRAALQVLHDQDDEQRNRRDAALVQQVTCARAARHAAERARTVAMRLATALGSMRPALSSASATRAMSVASRARRSSIAWSTVEDHARQVELAQRMRAGNSDSKSASNHEGGGKGTLFAADAEDVAFAATHVAAHRVAHTAIVRAPVSMVARAAPVSVLARVAAAGGRLVVILKSLWAVAPLAGLATYVLARWRAAASMWAGNAPQSGISGANEVVAAHAEEGGSEEARTLLGRHFVRSAPATDAPPLV